MNQRGFATLEVILMVMVIGVLASIAVPRFTAVTAAANTSKIQADLTTIDTAVEVYYMENGSYPTEDDMTKNTFKKYFKGEEIPKPPMGAYYLEGTIKDASADLLTKDDTYSLDTSSPPRATLKDSTADKFYVQDRTTTPASGT